jgi:CheY-like chemotaxis protein
LKNDLNYRHIPIYIISGEENRKLALKRGARNFLMKPLNNDLVEELFLDIKHLMPGNKRQVLLIEDNETESSQLLSLLTDDNIEVFHAVNGKDAVDLIDKKPFDCIIVDWMLPDMSGMDLLSEINSKKQPLTQIIIYTAKDFSKTELKKLNNYSHIVLLKDVNSVERLIEETVASLHINFSALPAEKVKLIENNRKRDDILTGKKILVVDDDVRNLFALTTVFERLKINVITAESGHEAIRLLNENDDIEMVLMDIMMPEMDGYETTQKIRREHKNTALPIIAVTAKAMKGDRQKCIDAGASDYITKPLKVDQLLSLMRVWFYK